jgi:hypothetical protein
MTGAPIRRSLAMFRVLVATGRLPIGILSEAELRIHACADPPGVAPGMIESAGVETN